MHRFEAMVHQAERVDQQRQDLESFILVIRYCEQARSVARNFFLYFPFAEP